jgi:hypothetical protein
MHHTICVRWHNIENNHAFVINILRQFLDRLKIYIFTFSFKFLYEINAW